MSGRVLIAGIGNIFQTDDAFGVEVAGRLVDHPLPDHVRVEDFGIRGVHLAYELLEGYDTLIVIDAVPMGEPPGTLVVMEPELGARPTSSDPDDPALDAHTMSPDVVLATLERLGGSVRRIFIVGCQPADLREGMGLTPAVEATVGAATNLCLELLTDVAPIGKGMPA
ncbi:MAG TPA: hydrogenase maturation protease [Acidimicrobiales bacterium]|nr:hydrogenase maturation protease [Acidimicrobiales bacterium]